jgi:hypothetical protein
MNKVEIGNLIGEFIWNFGSEFFIETDYGNFIWSDPDYGGDNTIRKYRGSFSKYIKGGFGRDKGRHKIFDFCGDGFCVMN